MNSYFSENEDASDILPNGESFHIPLVYDLIREQGDNVVLIHCKNNSEFMITRDLLENESQTELKREHIYGVMSANSNFYISPGCSDGPVFIKLDTVRYSQVPKPDGPRLMTSWKEFTLRDCFPKHIVSSPNNDMLCCLSTLLENDFSTDAMRLIRTDYLRYLNDVELSQEEEGRALNVLELMDILGARPLKGADLTNGKLPEVDFELCRKFAIDYGNNAAKNRDYIAKVCDHYPSFRTAFSWSYELFTDPKKYLLSEAALFPENLKKFPEMQGKLRNGNIPLTLARAAFLGFAIVVSLLTEPQLSLIWTTAGVSMLKEYRHKPRHEEENTPKESDQDHLKIWIAKLEPRSDPLECKV